MLTQDSEGRLTETVIQSFGTEQDAARAIAALRTAGFGTADIGVLARDVGREEVVAAEAGAVPIEDVHLGTVTGRVLGGGGGILLGLTVAVMPGIAPLLGATGMIVTMLAGTGAGGVAGGIVGGLGALGVPTREARKYRERFAAGDIIVVVHAPGRQREVERILAHGTLGS